MGMCDSKMRHRCRFKMLRMLVALVFAALPFTLTACSDSAEQGSAVEEEAIDGEAELGTNEKSSEWNDVEELKDSVSQLKSDAKEMFSGFTEGFSESSDNAVNSGEEASEPLDGDGYRVGLDIECERNAFFSTYDVEVHIDGKNVGRINHGSSGAFEVKLAGGAHTLEVFSEDDASLNGSFDFAVSEDTLQNVVLQCKSYGVLISSAGSFGSIEDSLAHLGEAGGKAADALDFLGVDEIASYGFDDDEDFLNCRDGEWAARKNFENYGETVYPNGFDCFWKTGLIACEPQEDGSYLIEVNASAVNNDGFSDEVRAGGVVKGSDVSDFWVDM